MSKKKRRFSIDCSGESATQQHFKESADINNILAHFRSTGVDPYAQRRADQKFGYATSKTFEEAMRQTAEIQSCFNDLPAKERQAFSNDPTQWLNAMGTPEPDPDPEPSPEPSQEVPDPTTEDPKPPKSDST